MADASQGVSGERDPNYTKLGPQPPLHGVQP